MTLLRSARRMKSAGVAAVLIGTASVAVTLGAAQSSPGPGFKRTTAAPAQPQRAGGIAPEGLARIDALLREKATRSPVERKIDSQLLYARRMQQGLPVAPGVRTLRVDVPYAADGHLVVDVRGNVTTGLLARLGRFTREVVKSSPHDLQLHVTLAQVETIAADPDVAFVQPRQRAFTSGVRDRKAPTPRTAGAARRAATGDALRHALAERAASRLGTGQGSVTSQADIAHRTAIFRAMTGADGSGVKIGVLSDGVTNLARAQSTGDLGPVTVLPGQEGGGDEGTAMLELLHDIAPGAQLYFATAFVSIPSFAQNIEDLRAAGCDIIVDDVFYFVETPFQDGQAPGVESITNGGLVTQAVKTVTADGALYFSSAGNAGNLDNGTSGVWEGDFADGGPTADPLPAGTLHDFAPGQPYNTLTLDGQGLISLFWADPLGASGNDYDLFGLNADGTDVVTSSTNIQDGTQDPYEQTISDILNPRIVIVKAPCAEGRFLHLNTNWGQLDTATAGQTHGHAATSAPLSFGVAASSAADPYPGPFRIGDVVEAFSSDGPRRILFNADGTAITPGNLSSTGGVVLLKPDFTAADGVSVTGAGFFDGQFYGTSAAAPNAAAIAALFKSANPSWTPAQVKNALLSSALDIEAPGFDRDSGAGIVMAVAPQPGCTFSTTGATATVGASGGPGSASVTASGGSCTWIAWSTVNWIAVNGSGVATGSKPLGYVVAPNPGPTRVGIIQIEGGQTVTVTQLGAPPTVFGSTTPLEIPDEGTGESSIVVSGLTRPIANLTVSLHATHTFDADLTISLVGPDGTSIDLSANNGSSGQDYGTACTAPGVRTTFDDAAAVLISSGSAPFAGQFRPEQPLSTFNGKSGAAANGTWKLRINDAFAQDTGTLLCWSLQINEAAPLPSFPEAAQLGVFRPSTGRWFLTGQPEIDFGVAGDLPVPGDYDGDGVREVAVFRPSNGTWYIDGGATVVWGAAGDIPVPADYDGDHVTDIAVFRPSAGIFYVRDGVTVKWGATGDLPVVGDYNGDGRADIAVYRPSNGTWYVRGIVTAVFGLAADTPAPADYDGDGTIDIAVFRPATGTWFVKDQYTESWGLPGDVAVPMDRNHDGRAEVGVFRRSTGTWYFKDHVTGATEMARWGASGDIPLGRAMPPVETSLGDYDGDRKADLTVYRPSSGDWLSLRSVNGRTDYTVHTWGLSTDVPVGRDYDGDGKIDPAVFRPSLGRWLVLQSSMNYAAHTSEDWGVTSDTPVPADYDGDGKADHAVFRSSIGRWLILLSSSGNTAYAQHDWGLDGDVPVPADYDGDGVDDLGVFRPSTGQWFVLNRITGEVTTRDWGLTGDVPVAADFDGDGRADIAVFRPSLGRWFITSSTGGSYTTADWGVDGDVPVAADYDADGKADVAVYRPSNGTWYVQGLLERTWGLVGDVPVLK